MVMSTPTSSILDRSQQRQRGPRAPSARPSATSSTTSAVTCTATGQRTASRSPTSRRTAPAPEVEAGRSPSCPPTLAAHVPSYDVDLAGYAPPRQGGASSSSGSSAVPMVATSFRELQAIKDAQTARNSDMDNAAAVSGDITGSSRESTMREEAAGRASKRVGAM
jgi:hypothetical protein